jgi:hypothetical protein
VITGGRMLMMLGLAMVAIAAMLLFPDSGTARALDRWLVQTPAKMLDRVGSGRMVLYAALAVAGLLLVLVFEAEGLRLFGLMLPDTLVWFAMFDVGVFVDALLISGAILATNGLRAVKAQVLAARGRAAMLVRRTAGRARRAVRPRSRPQGRSADDEGPAWARQAAYRAFSMA